MSYSTIIRRLNLRGIEAKFAIEHADQFQRDLQTHRRTDYGIVNQPFNDFDWFRKDNNPASRDWQPSVQPKGNANLAWAQALHLQPRATRHGRLRPRQWVPQSRDPPNSPAKAISAAPSPRPTSWTAWSHSPASHSKARRLPSASDSSRKTKTPTPNVLHFARTSV